MADEAILLKKQGSNFSSSLIPETVKQCCFLEIFCSQNTQSPAFNALRSRVKCFSQNISIKVDIANFYFYSSL